MSGEYLRECATHGHTDELRRILKEKCNPCSVDKFGLTALHYAVWNGHVECVKYLVCNNWGVDKNGIKRHALNMVSVRGFSALHLAAQDAPQWVAQEITELLLISGVDPTTVDKDGKLAIDYARRENNEEVLAAFNTYDQLMDALRQREEEANRLEGTVLDDTIEEEGDSEEVKQMLEAATPVGPTPVSILPVETFLTTSELIIPLISRCDKFVMWGSRLITFSSRLHPSSCVVNASLICRRVSVFKRNISRR
jgi:ankyrin repeat protein